MKTETYEVQIGKLLEQLTLEEKIGMIHGAGLFRTGGGWSGFPYRRSFSRTVRWACVRNLGTMSGEIQARQMILSAISRATAR